MNASGSKVFLEREMPQPLPVSCTRFLTPCCLLEVISCGMRTAHRQDLTPRLLMQTLCLHPAWESMLPWSLGSLCKGIADGQHALEFPLTVHGRQQLIPLGTLCGMDPRQVLLSVPTNAKQSMVYTLNPPNQNKIFARPRTHEQTQVVKKTVWGLF